MTVDDSSRDSAPSRDHAADRAGPIPWWPLATVLLVICCVLSLSSLTYVHGEGYETRPIAPLVVLLGAAGIIYIVCAVKSLRHPPPLRLALGVSLLARLILLPSTPIQEDDIYRYLWDGRVLHHGVNPYLFSPGEIEAYEKTPGVFSPGDAPKLKLLARLSRSTDAVSSGFARINHREYATIYPPACQGVFWCFGALVPDSWSIAAQVTAMKALLFLFDMAIVLLVVVLLRMTGKDPGLVVLYGWCPLVFKELSNSGHMDAIPTFFLLASLAALLSRRGTLTGVFLGVAVSAKIYAVLVLPLFLKRLGVKRGALALVACLVVLGVSHVVTGEEGRTRYRETLFSFVLLWENHDAVFLWLQSFAALFVGADTDVTVTWGHLEEFVPLAFLSAMVAFVVALASLVVWSLVRLKYDTPKDEILWRVFLLFAALFLIGPVGFPWYFIWCMPLMPFAKSRSWWVLPCLLPVYYLRFWFDYHYEDGFAGFASGTGFFDYVVVNLEFGVFFALLAAELIGRRRAASATRRSL